VTNYKRLVLLVQNLPVPFDRRVWQEATSLQSQGYDVTVICPSNDGHPAGSFTIENVKVERFQEVVEADNALGYVREYSLSLIRMLRALLMLTKEHGSFNVVHFCNPPDLLAILAWWYKRRYGAKVVFDQHDLGPELVKAKNIAFPKIFEWLARVFEHFAYSVADAVIATNESYKRAAVTRGHKSPDQVTVVRSGPRRHWMQGVVPSDRWKGDSKYLVSYLGVIGSQEGLDLAIEAFALLRRSWGESIVFVVAGGGTELPALKKLTAQLGMSDQVVFLGRVSDADLKSLLASSDCSINPDRWSELNNLSTMNKVIEYMAAGSPIVQFDLKEGKASAGDASLYARPDDVEDLAQKIKRVLEDPQLRASMRNFALDRFSRDLCWETQESKLFFIYERLLRV